jgi:hypothetical protein
LAGLDPLRSFLQGKGSQNGRSERVLIDRDNVAAERRVHNHDPASNLARIVASRVEPFHG